MKIIYNSIFFLLYKNVEFKNSANQRKYILTYYNSPLCKSWILWIKTTGKINFYKIFDITFGGLHLPELKGLKATKYYCNIPIFFLLTSICLFLYVPKVCIF